MATGPTGLEHCVTDAVENGGVCDACPAFLLSAEALAGVL